jgi:hypothetical protein
MNVRHNLVRLGALTVVVSMPLLGLAGVASAKAAKGSAAWCAAHPAKQNTALCASSSGSGGATGQPAPALAVTVSPNPVVETGQSEIKAIIEVEASPAFAGDLVNISSSQLAASCIQAQYETLQGGSPLGNANAGGPVRSNDNISVVLDDDGNATVALNSTYDCAPGSDVIEADLESAPYLTALTTLVATPPVTTAAGVTGYPDPEVETGDTTNGPNGGSGNSDVYAVFYVETSPVYAEQPVEISAAELESSCGQGWRWEPGNGGAPNSFADGFTGDVYGIDGPDIGALPTALLDDDGNAVFVFDGASCAAGTWDVIADVRAGDHPTYTTTFTVDPPAPTI